MPSTESRFVGRRQELALVQRALESLDTGATSVLQLTGEAGIGKTRLLTEALNRAQEHDCLALAGRGVEFEGNLPFAIFIDALDEHLASLEPHFLEDLASERIRELAGIFPAVASLTAERPSGLPVERHHAYQAVRALLERLAAEQPLVLALDDLHWTDAASIELLSHLLRRLPASPVLLLLAFRPHHASSNLVSALPPALQGGVGQRIDLTSLSLAEATELLEGTVERTALEDLYRESGGNPFFLEQLARSATRNTSSALAVEKRLGEAGVPPAVATTIADEIGALSEPTRTVIQAAAVVGETFERDITAQTAGASEEQVLAAIDESLDLDLIRLTDVPYRFRFRHPIVRRAVYESSKACWRLAAHERAAEALRGRGAPAMIRAHHVERSAQPGDETAIALLAEAGRESAQRAPAAAAGWFRAALDLLPEEPDGAERRLQLLVPMGVALASAGRLSEASNVLHEVLDLVPPELTLLKVQAAFADTNVQILLGNVDRAQENLREAIAALDDPLSYEAALLKSGLAATCWVRSDFDGMRSLASEALKGLTTDPPGRSVTLGVLAAAECALDDLTPARAHISEAAELADRLSDREMALRPAAFFWLGWCETLSERFDDAIRHLERGIAISRKTGQGQWFVQMEQQEAPALMWRGQLQRAADLVEAGVEAALLSANNLALVPGLSLRCWIKTMTGDHRAAIRLGENAVAADANASSPMFRRLAECCLAQALLEAGKPQRCRDLLLPPGSSSLPPTPLYPALWCEALTRAELALGNMAEAERWTAHAQSIAEQSGLNLPLVHAGRARAATALAREDAAEAREAALESVSAAQAVRAPVEAARSRTLAATALAAAGERDQAVTELEQAHSELAGFGALAFRDQTARELRRLGHRVRQRITGTPASTGILALTDRQLQVAELVNSGKKNREIATDLSISEKTVELHLSQAFAKLGASSRAQVAAIIERERAQLAD